MISLLTKLRRILSPKLKWFAVAQIVVMFIGALLELIGLGLIFPAVAAIADPTLLQSNKYLCAIYEFLNPSSVQNFLLIFAVSIIFFYIFKCAYLIFMSYTQSAYASAIALNISDRIFRNYIKAPYNTFLSTTSTEIMNKIIMVQPFSNNFILPILQMFAEGVVVLLILAVMFFIVPSIALFVFITGAVAITVFYLPIKKYIGVLGTRTVTFSEGILETLRDALGNIKTIKVANAQQFYSMKHYEVEKHYNHTYKLLSVYIFLPRLLLETFVVAIAMMIMIFLVMHDIPTTTIIISASLFVAAMFRLLPSFSRIQYYMILIRRNTYLFDIIYNDLQGLPAERMEDSCEINFRNEISINNISFAYPEQEKNVIENFSMTIHPLESIAVVGPTGCGKSTLIDILMGFLQPQSGTVCSDGVNIFDSLHQWRSKIGYVPQNIYLINDTITRNVAFALADDRINHERVTEVLKTAQIFDFVNTLPDGINTMIGESGIRLSGGQRQRIAIARALYHNPEILILDEATSALDNETEKTFIDAVATLKGKLTIIMIAHRISSLAHCDRTISIEKN